MMLCLLAAIDSLHVPGVGGDGVRVAELPPHQAHHKGILVDEATMVEFISWQLN